MAGGEKKNACRKTNCDEGGKTVGGHREKSTHFKKTSPNLGHSANVTSGTGFSGRLEECFVGMKLLIKPCNPSALGICFPNPSRPMWRGGFRWCWLHTWEPFFREVQKGALGDPLRLSGRQRLQMARCLLSFGVRLHAKKSSSYGEEFLSAGGFSSKEAESEKWQGKRFRGDGTFYGRLSLFQANPPTGEVGSKIKAGSRCSREVCAGMELHYRWGWDGDELFFPLNDEEIVKGQGNHVHR